MNIFVAIGRCTELKRDMTKGGTMVVRFGLAETAWNYSTKQEQVNFHNLVGYGKIADRLDRYVKKGDKICVIGVQTVRTYSSAAGESKKMVETVISEFEFCENRNMVKQRDFYKSKASESAAMFALMKEQAPEAAEALERSLPDSEKLAEAVKKATEALEKEWLDSGKLNETAKIS